MNILVFSWRDHLHPLAGGAEQVMREHIKGWIKAGHKVTLFSSRFAGCRNYEESDGIQIVHSGDQYIGVKIDALRYWLKNEKKFDLLVDQFHGIPFFTPLYVKKPKLAVLQEVAKEVWFLNGFPFPLNYLIGLIGYLGESFIFPLYKKVPFMVGSQSARDDLAKMGIPPKNITIIPHGVIVKKPSRKIRKEKIKTITFLGALTKDKGVEDAIKTFSILNKKGTYQFWTIGKGGKDYLNYLKRLALELGLKRLKFWGFVDEEKKFELLSRSHLLINTSAREGWGLVNIEANAMGTPVVAYRSAGLIDSVKNGQSGVFCDKNTPANLAEMVVGLLQSKEKYSRLSTGAKKWSKNFNWEISRKRSLILITNILRKNEKNR